MGVLEAAVKEVGVELDGLLLVDDDMMNEWKA